MYREDKTFFYKNSLKNQLQSAKLLLKHYSKLNTHNTLEKA